MNRIIDAKGKNCPIPVIMAKKEIDNGGEAFVVEVDNAIAVENLKKLAAGHKLQSEQEKIKEQHN